MGRTVADAMTTSVVSCRTTTPFKDIVRRDDVAIFEEVMSRVLLRTLWIDPSTVRVEVDDGVVRLFGQLERRSLVEIVEGLVRGVDGVVTVDSRLTYLQDDTAIRPERKEAWSVLPRALRAP